MTPSQTIRHRTTPQVRQARFISADVRASVSIPAAADLLAAVAA